MAARSRPRRSGRASRARGLRIGTGCPARRRRADHPGSTRQATAPADPASRSRRSPAGACQSGAPARGFRRCGSADGAPSRAASRPWPGSAGRRAGSRWQQRRGRPAPCSHSCITAIAVNVLVMEAIRKTVSSVTGVFDPMSARPCPWKNSRDPLRTTPTARPTAGRRLRISSTVALISSRSTVGIAPPPLTRPAARPPSTPDGQSPRTNIAPTRVRREEATGPYPWVERPWPVAASGADAGGAGSYGKSARCSRASRTR